VKVLEREIELAVSDEKSIPVRLSASQMHNAEGLFLGHLFIFGDIGEVKRLQNEVQRNERLTALGNLAAGIAHEIRNPLSTIKGLVAYIGGKLPAGWREEEAAKTMIVEVNRLNAVVSELLEFARPSVAKGERVDMDEVICRALRLAEADIQDKQINVDFTPIDAIPPVQVNPERFAQALLNLFLNAIQAMQPGGTLRVYMKTRRAENDFCVMVEDNGTGMSDDVRESIFNPYFTTKPSGTGLGLAVVHQIVEGHGGKVTVKSSPGAGSVFTIHLPVADDALRR
jgi:two-component system sensor histidine kinase HydH